MGELRKLFHSERYSYKSLQSTKNKLSSKFELITASLGSRTAATQAGSQQMLLTVLTHAVWLVLPLSAHVNVYQNLLRLSLPPLHGPDVVFYHRPSKVKCCRVGVRVSIQQLNISFSIWIYFFCISPPCMGSCVYPESQWLRGGCEANKQFWNALAQIAAQPTYCSYYSSS